MTKWPVSGNKTFYGQFCFGCTAPDVDKISQTLTQKETHFFDRTGDYELMATHRSAVFIERQAQFLQRPFGQLDAQSQAFALGYLCHLCVDEVSKHLWRRETWIRLKIHNPGIAFAALDEAARQRLQDHPAIVRTLASLRVLNVIPRIPPAELQDLFEGVYAFARATSTEEEYLALVDLFDRPAPEQRRQKQQALRAEIGLARSQVHLFQLDRLVEAGLKHSRTRLAELIEGRPARPGYPPLE